jgi:hypothetical protein
MELNRITYGNKLIAEFMGGKFLGTDEYETRHGSHDVYLVDRWQPPYGIPHQNNANIGIFDYHLSWDWVMPVVEMIENIGENTMDVSHNYHFDIAKRFVRVVYNWKVYLTFDGTCDKYSFEDFTNSYKEYRYAAYDMNKLQCVWLACVEFIEWYNASVQTV